MVSYRWINFCIDRKQLVRDLKKHRLPNLLPCPKTMPLPEFLGIKVCIKGFDDHQKFVLREIVKVMGGSCVEWKFRSTILASDRLVFICKDLEKMKKDLAKDKVLSKNGIETAQLPVKQSPWLFKTQFTGKIEL